MEPMFVCLVFFHNVYNCNFQTIEPDSFIAGVGPGFFLIFLALSRARHVFSKISGPHSLLI